MQAAIEVIRAAVASVREHAVMNFLCDGIPACGHCDGVRWAEAALKMAERWESLRVEGENALAWYVARVRPAKHPMWNVSQAKELERSAREALAEIADGLK